MLWVRGDAKTYDLWANEMGCEEWSYEKVLPYFKKCENYTDSRHNKKDDSIHGTGGPITIMNMASPECASPVQKMLQSVVAAGREQGLDSNEDYNGPTQESINLAQVNVKNGNRHDVYTAYVVHSGAEKRPNLTVITNSMVTKVVIQGDKAVGVMLKQKNVPLCDERRTKAGVQSMRDTATVFIGARKEVIMSAGAVCTPWLLMLSGVGPRDHLEDVGIPVVKDLPVGEGMQDHFFWDTQFVGKRGVGFNASKSVAALSDLAGGAYDWLVKGKGMFCLPMVHALAFFRSGKQDEKWGTDCELHIVPFQDTDREQVRRNTGVPMLKEKTASITILPTL
jgi:choline dehydrogenase